MVKTAAWGSLVFAIALGLHNYRVEGTVFGIIWGVVGLIIGMGVGVLACIPANSNHSLLRLSQATIQGVAWGTLIGTGLQAFIVVADSLLVHNGFPSGVSFSEAAKSIRSFAICGGTLGIIIVMQAFIKKVGSENKRRQTALKFILVGVVSSIVLYIWLVLVGFFMWVSVTGILLLVIPGAILSGIVGIIFAANR